MFNRRKGRCSVYCESCPPNNVEHVHGAIYLLATSSPLATRITKPFTDNFDLTKINTNEMCHTVGVEWRCGHSFMTSRTPCQGGARRCTRVKPVPTYQVQWRCSSTCCSQFLTMARDAVTDLVPGDQHYATTKAFQSRRGELKSKYEDCCGRHLGCLQQFALGLGMSDVMRDNLKQERVQDVVPPMDFDFFRPRTNSTAERTELEHFQRMLLDRGGRFSYVAQPKTAVEQCLFIQQHPHTLPSRFLTAGAGTAGVSDGAQQKVIPTGQASFGVQSYSGQYKISTSYFQEQSPCWNALTLIVSQIWPLKICRAFRYHQRATWPPRLIHPRER